MRPLMLFATLACVSLVGCGGGGETPSKPKPTATAPAETGPALPKEPPAVSAADRRRLDRCVDRWNADIGRADAKTAHRAIADRARDDLDGLLATVTVYDGKRIAQRRDDCVVVVSQGTTVFAPFSRSREERRWVASCELAGATTDPDKPRACSEYTDPLAREANATVRADGRLRLRVRAA